MAVVRRAVVCDDDPRIRRVVTALLADLEFEVVAEVDLATDALRVVELSKPDVLVLDVGLKGISGLEALPAIRGMAPGCRIVVFSASDIVRDEAFALGAYAVCDKDNPLGLEATLRALAVS
jgi:CheY-like chemotaxis protein